MNLKSLVQLIAAVMKPLIEWAGASQLIKDAGWLPHYTIPKHLLDDCAADADSLKSRLSEYYTHNWPSVRTKIESRLKSYCIDDEARETFREALNAHEAGLYRCSVRVLLPELERLARVHSGYVNNFQDSPIKKLLNDLGNRTFDDVMLGDIYNHDFFGVLIQHLYEQVKTKVERQKFARSSIPNRHAAVHGLLPYSSMENSLNTIFLAEYVLQLIDFPPAEKDAATQPHGSDPASGVTPVAS